jgi:AcrR family transcriptional regulator
VPTGVAIPDVRQQLFDAAERVLRQAGPAGLTSRAVTTEAGCAKGVLHRHFADFDAFLLELVADRTARLEGQAQALRGAVGTGTVTGNLATALTGVFGSVAVAMVGLLIFRDDLRARLRQRYPAGIPLLNEAGAMVRDYLALEQRAGRIRADADLDALGLGLIGSGHLVFADRSGEGPDPDAVLRVVGTVLAGALP